MDAAELGFVFGTENQTASLSSGGPQQRIVASKERGLRPILRSLQNWMNNWFVYQVDEDYELEFVGLDSISEQEKLEMDMKAVKFYKTVNEIRQEHDLKPLDSPLADMILDPTYLNSAFAMLQQEQMEGEEGMEGPEGMGGMPGPEGMEGMGGPEGGMMPGMDEEQAAAMFEQAGPQPETPRETDMSALTEALVEKAERGIDDNMLTPLKPMKKGQKRALRYMNQKAFIVEV